MLEAVIEFLDQLYLTGYVWGSRRKTTKPFMSNLTGAKNSISKSDEI